MKKSILTISIFFSIFLSTNGFAHAIWFAERASQVALVYGVGADDLPMVKRRHQIEQIEGYDEDWNRVPTDLLAAGPLLLVDSDDLPVAVSAVFYNGIWSQAESGDWYRGEIANPVVVEKIYKYAVHIPEKLNSAIPSIPSQTLQIIPVNGIPEMMGEAMTLKVILNGKPIAGAEVKVDFVNDPDASPIITAKDGTATIKVRNQGLNVVYAYFKGPPDDTAGLNAIQHTATLSFVLEHEPE